MWPDVAVMIVTYDRPDEIRRVIRALDKHLQYNKGKFVWYLADDGSLGNYVSDIQRDFANLGFRTTITKRLGWGANVNKCMRKIGEQYIFLCEDDYVALYPLDINQGIALLSSKTANIGLVRYDGLAGHRLNLAIEEIKTPSLGMLQYLEILKKDSRGLNVYSNRPHLKHVKFHRGYGEYPMGKSLGETESAFAHRIKDILKGPKLVALENGIRRAFDHVGKSRQGTGLDQTESK